MPGRQNIEIEIYGMEGIPEEDLKNHERNKSKKGMDGNELFFCVELLDYYGAWDLLLWLGILVR